MGQEEGMAGGGRCAYKGGIRVLRGSSELDGVVEVEGGRIVRAVARYAASSGPAAQGERKPPAECQSPLYDVDGCKTYRSPIYSVRQERTLLTRMEGVGKERSRRPLATIFASIYTILQAPR